MLPYVLLQKQVGETPLQCLETHRNKHPELKNVPLAYAGRLDPMASGKLLVLQGDECKVQEKYHSLDKAYRFEVMFGTGSDTQDILGLLSFKNQERSLKITKEELASLTARLTGKISLPYPLFSSKTVHGKPLHTWTLEDRLNEIEIPMNQTTIYKLILEDLYQVPALSIYESALARINSLPAVTDKSKSLGQDFRRKAVHLSWQVWLEHHKNQMITIGRFYCIASSGTYMRSLAKEIGQQFKTDALAFSIDRTMIGKYQTLPLGFGFWRKKF